jgi:hypothetical protein
LRQVIPSHSASAATKWLAVATEPGGDSWRDEFGSAVEVSHYMLDSGVIFQPVERKIFAVSGMLEASMRHFSDERYVGIDPHAAEIKPLRHAHSPPMVRGPHAGC